MNSEEKEIQVFQDAATDFNNSERKDIQEASESSTCSNQKSKKIKSNSSMDSKTAKHDQSSVSRNIATGMEERGRSSQKHQPKSEVSLRRCKSEPDCRYQTCQGGITSWQCSWLNPPPVIPTIITTQCTDSESDGGMGSQISTSSRNSTDQSVDVCSFCGYSHSTISYSNPSLASKCNSAVCTATESDVGKDSFEDAATEDSPNLKSQEEEEEEEEEATVSAVGRFFEEAEDPPAVANHPLYTTVITTDRDVTLETEV